MNFIPPMNTEDVLFFYRGGTTKRFHTARTIRENTVGQHSFGVAWFCWVLTGAPSSTLLMAALAHDLPEQLTGDVPSPTKRACPQLEQAMGQMESRILIKHCMNYESSLTEDEKRTLKIADCLDGLMFCLVEYNMGNHEIEEALHNFIEYCVEMATTEREKRLVSIVASMAPTHLTAGIHSLRVMHD